MVQTADTLVIPTNEILTVVTPARLTRALQATEGRA